MHFNSAITNTHVFKTQLDSTGVKNCSENTEKQAY